MTTKEFAKRAKKKYDGQIRFGRLKTTEETANKIGISKNKIERYPAQVWLINGDKCPHCQIKLMGLFGSFTWGIEHGVGYCSSCKKTVFRYYHYIQKNKAPIEMLSLVGFP